MRMAAVPAANCLYLTTALQIGDWGRKGISQQKRVAKMMATVADCMPPAFIISTGDNFYSRECALSEATFLPPPAAAVICTRQHAHSKV
jgi:hypothetical protein